MNIKEHLLVCLMEEAAEVAKDVSKSLRFGMEDRNILNPTGPTNRERLIEELNDFMAVIAMLTEYEVLPADWLDVKKGRAKHQKLLKFMGYAMSNGTLHEPTPPPQRPLYSHYEQKGS